MAIANIVNLPKSIQRRLLKWSISFQFFEDGKTELENIAFACRSCNGSKNIKITGIDPLSGKPVPLFNPRKQNWKEHFKWSEDFLKIIGLTQTGQATTIELKMNRLEHLNLRKLLVKNGEHPPVV